MSESERDLEDSIKNFGTVRYLSFSILEIENILIRDHQRFLFMLIFGIEEVECMILVEN